MKRIFRRFGNAYVLSAFTRAVFAYLGYVLATSFFSARSGSAGFSSLILWSNALSMSFTVLFSTTRLSERVMGVYQGLVGLAMAMAAWAFFTPTQTVVVLVFGILMFALDVIGGNLLGYSIQASASPSVVRELNHACMSAEVAARLFCSLFLTGMLGTGQWGTLLVLAVLCGAIHVAVHRRVPAPPVVGTHGGSARLRQAMGYIFRDRLARSAFLALGWAQFAKFLVECLYFEATQQEFQTAAAIGAFTSAASVATLAVNLGLQTTVGAWAIRVFPMTGLLLLLPTTVVLGAPLTLVLPTVWTALGLYVVFQILHRSIQVPVARQGLYPAPVELQPAIGPALSLLISGGVLFFSWLTPLVRGLAGVYGLVVMLLTGTAVVIFAVARMDARYIRNLRRLHRQRTGGEWVENMALGAPADALPMNWAAPTILDEEEEETPETHFQLGELTQVRSTYLHSLDWSEAMRTHRAALSSGFARTRGAATWLALFLGPSVRERALKGNPKAAPLLQRVSWAESLPLQNADSSTRRKLKELVLLNTASEAEWQELGRAFPYLTDGQKRRLIDALADPELDAVRDLMWQVIRATALSGRLNLEPAWEPIWGLTYGESGLHRRFLDRFKITPTGLGAALERQLVFLREHKFDLRAFDGDRKRARERQVFLHCLFLEEWVGFPGRVGREIRQTIRDFSSLDEAERALLLDLHSHFLKRSPRAALWRPFLS